MTIKKGPLSNADKTYIKKYLNKVTIDSMSRHLNRAYKTVEKYHNELVAISEQEDLEKNASPIEETPTALNLMGRNQRFGAVVMTEAASMSADDSLKKRENFPSSRYKNCIKKIRDE